MAPLKIGLTGGIAAGKSEALKAFARLGAATLSSDTVVHELLESEPLRGRLAERWGAEVVSEGGVDRARIGEIVFADPEQLTWLEHQIHPLVQTRTAEWLLSLPEGTEVARGLVNYNAQESRRIAGRASSEIEAILGYIDGPELIHRDNLVLL